MAGEHWATGPGAWWLPPRGEVPWGRAGRERHTPAGQGAGSPGEREAAQAPVPAARHCPAPGHTPHGAASVCLCVLWVSLS